MYSVTLRLQYIFTCVYGVTTLLQYSFTCVYGATTSLQYIVTNASCSLLHWARFSQLTSTVAKVTCLLFLPVVAIYFGYSVAWPTLLPELVSDLKHFGMRHRRYLHVRCLPQLQETCRRLSSIAIALYGWTLAALFAADVFGGVGSPFGLSGFRVAQSKAVVGHTLFWKTSLVVPR